MSKRNIRIILGLSCIFIFVVTFIGCETKKQTEEALSVPVSVVKAEKETIFDTIQFVGDIKASDEAEVFPRASGKVNDKLKQEGDFVKKDDVIMYVDRDEIGFEFELSPVVSPLGGFIGRIYVDKGDSVTIQSPVANIVDIDSVKIRIDVPEKYLPKIYIGQPVKLKVDAYPDREFEAKITTVSPQVDIETRTFPIEASLDNKKHILKPGMFAKLEIILREEKDAIIIPREAIIRGLNNQFVYVAESNIAKKRIVTLGIQKLDKVQVISGIKIEDKVIIRGQQRLKDGIGIEIVRENNK